MGYRVASDESQTILETVTKQGQENLGVLHAKVIFHSAIKL
jgi:hypothetical protein